MRCVFLIIIFIKPLFSLSQHDNVLEALDSLSKVYYFKKIELDTGNKYNYKPGFIPKCSDEEYARRFEELNKNSPFKLVYNPIVKKYIDNYLKGYKFVAVILANSKYYFPKYDDYFLKYSVPLELKYLSIIESALNPTAKSYCGAAGLWQFMPATGRAYGLNITSYVDERYNIDLATDAACRYLKDLYTIYDDWALAIAAYNCGPGNVNKAIKRSGGKKDFFSIMNYLPKETQGYVPAYMAATYIMNYSEEHNIPRIKSKIGFTDIDYIEIHKTTTIAKLASILGLTPKELSYLNPAYYIGVIPGNNDRVIIPKEKAMLFIDKETAINGSMKQAGKSIPKDSETKILHKKTEKNAPESFSETPVKSVFGTIEIRESGDTLKQIKEIFGPIKEVILCEVVNGFNANRDENIRVRNLKIIAGTIPKNFVLLGKVEIRNNKKILHFFSVLNTKESLHYFAEFNESFNEGETIYLSNQF